MRGIRAALASSLIALAGCTIGRVYQGTALPDDPAAALVRGRTTKSEALHVLGPPSRIHHQTDGDIFSYTYDRTNYKSFAISEPVITHFTLFSWSRQDGRRDKLVLFFDRAGILEEWGLDRETADL
jgi:outer membrane protein assembly factor BamE (lipoprotein component of BamABCDE complex)